MTAIADRRCVILFVKYPEKGKVKSRLAQDLDEDFVLRLYQCMVLDTIDMLKRLNVPFRICYYPLAALEEMKTWLGRAYVYAPQAGDHLGERMERAFSRVFSEGVDQALLIGSDIPGLTAAMMDGAFRSFASHDAVIGPANDGGYYLIGFKKNTFYPGIFHDMIWSTKTVFRMTIERLHSASLSVQILPECIDVDTKEDLKTFLDQLERKGITAARTVTFLNDHRSSIAD